MKCFVRVYNNLNLHYKQIISERTFLIQCADVHASNKTYYYYHRESSNFSPVKKKGVYKLIAWHNHNALIVLYSDTPLLNFEAGIITATYNNLLLLLILLACLEQKQIIAINTLNRNPNFYTRFFPIIVDKVSLCPPNLHSMKGMN